MRDDTPGRPLRPRGDGPARLADRPVQPAVQLLHAGRGPRLAADRPDADRRRGRPADHDRRAAPRDRARCASPGESRSCAAGWSTSSPARHALGVETSLTTNALGPDPHGAGPQGRRPRPDQRQHRHGPPGDLRTRSPAATGSRTSSRGSRRPRRPGSARSSSTPCCCAAPTTTRRPSCCAGRSSTATSCASSSRCRSTPSTTGAAPRW